MNEDKYLAESAVTDSPTFHSYKVPAAEMDAMLHAADMATRWADRVKRSLFYGADIDQKAIAIPTSLTLDSRHRDLIHGILGMFTEAGELMQHLHEVLTGQAVMDDINIIEELGDCYWYAAILHRILGVNFSYTMEFNIAKLKARYPDKFTEYAALNRDLDSERKVLEAGFRVSGGAG